MNETIGCGGLSIGKLAEMAGCQLMSCPDPERIITSVTLDSREKGDLFVALRGETTDGHRYISKALASGASAVIAEYIPEGITCPVLLTPDNGEAALGRIASAYRSLYHVSSVIVTGSIGKTTTKEMTASILSKAGKTHKTEGNHNSVTGMPLSLLSLDDSYQYGVWETGMSARGEVSFMAKIARPQAAIITNIGISHIEMLGSRENIRDAKLEVRDGLRQDGKLILNGDEPLLQGIDGAVYVSLDNTKADVYVEDTVNSGSGSSFTIVSRKTGRSTVKLPVFGKHAVFDALLAFAAAESMGIEPDKCLEGLADFRNVGDRQRIFNYHGVTLITDCYNAAPDSMKAGLDVLRETAHGRKIAVLGDMLELGELSEASHRLVGQFAAESCDILLTYGKRSELIASEAVASGLASDQVHCYDDSDPEAVASDLRGFLREGDTVLFKASHGIALEKVVTALTADDAV